MRSVLYDWADYKIETDSLKMGDGIHVVMGVKAGNQMRQSYLTRIQNKKNHEKYLYSMLT